jgi:hypothetical protein
MTLETAVRNSPEFAETGIEEKIRQRAYVLYQGRSTADGSALGDSASKGRSVGSQKHQVVTS